MTQSIKPGPKKMLNVELKYFVVSVFLYLFAPPMTPGLCLFFSPVARGVKDEGRTMKNEARAMLYFSANPI